MLLIKWQFEGTTECEKRGFLPDFISSSRFGEELTEILEVLNRKSRYRPSKFKFKLRPKIMQRIFDL